MINAKLNTKVWTGTEEEHMVEIRNETIANYKKAIDDEIVNFVLDVMSGRDVVPLTVGFVSEKMATRIYELTSIETEGNRIVLGADDVRHIINRHGPSGSADQSMKDIADIARLSYVLSNYDAVELANHCSRKYKTKEGKRAPQVVISKRVNGTYYVIEVVSDSSKRRNVVSSAYLQKVKG